MPKPKTSEVRGFNGVEPQKWPVFGLKTQKKTKKHVKNGRTSEVVRVTSERGSFRGGILTSEVVARDRFFFAFLRPCGQNRGVSCGGWERVFRGWPQYHRRSPRDHRHMLYMVQNKYKRDFSENLFSSLLQRLLLAESSRGCQRSSGYSPRCN